MNTIRSGALIAVLGVTGSGKSTFAEHIGKSLHAEVFKETFRGNPFIKGAHQKTAITFQNQLWFLMQASKRWEKATRVKIHGNRAVMDTYNPTPLIHAEVVMDDRLSVKLLTDLSEQLTSHLLRPDLLLYLYDESEFIYNRLKNRKLLCDDTTMEFIRRQKQCHESFLPTLSIPIMHIQARQLENLQREKTIIDEIKNHLGKIK